MIFDHVVNHNGIYYSAGQDVPIEKVQNEHSPSALEKHLYTSDELSGMTAKEIKRLADENGYAIKKTAKADIIAEFIAQQI